MAKMQLSKQQQLQHIDECMELLDFMADEVEQWKVGAERMVMRSEERRVGKEC